MQIKTVGALGCGLMGSRDRAGPAPRPATRRSYARWMTSRSNRGSAASGSSWTMAWRKVKCWPRRDKTISRACPERRRFPVSRNAISIVEAIIENLEDKRQAYRGTRRSAARHHLRMSNTSSLCITELAAASSRPGSIGGLHFFNPVPLMKLVEVIRALTTSDETYQTAVWPSARSLGKEPITRARPPRLHRQSAARAVSARCHSRIENGLSTPDDIDNGMKLGCGYPMGLVHAARLRRPRRRYSPPTSCSRSFASRTVRPRRCSSVWSLAGRLGKKTGQGFYSYAAGLGLNVGAGGARARARPIRARRSWGLVRCRDAVAARSRASARFLRDPVRSWPPMASMATRWTSPQM